MRIKKFVFIFLVIASTSASAKEILDEQTDLLIACSALFNVMSNDASVDKKAEVISRATEDVAKVHFKVRGLSISNGGMAEMRESAFKLFEDIHKKGNYNVLNKWSTMCGNWGVNIINYSTSDQASFMNEAMQKNDLHTIKAILMGPLARPSNIHDDNDEKVVRNAFRNWAAAGYPTPGKFKQKLRDEIAKNGHTDAINPLVTKGVDLNMATNDGHMALMNASIRGHIDTINALLAKGVDVNMVTNDGHTALMTASISGHIDVVNTLLAKGARVNMAMKTDGATALMLASIGGHIDIVSALLAKGADVNATKSGGVTSLILASQNDHANIVKTLLAKGAEVNTAMNDGRTALIWASYRGYIDIVKTLLRSGANVRMTLPGVGTATDIALQQGHQEIVEILRRSER